MRRLFLIIGLFVFLATGLAFPAQRASAQSPYFSNLAFSAVQGGPAYPAFTPGIKQVFVAFDYVNVPPGTTLVRDWYRDGQFQFQRAEAWNPAWGSAGRLTSISVYDFTEGLTPGTWQVAISLASYPASVIAGSFVIAVEPSVPAPGAQVYDLTTALTPLANAANVFPAGTQAVYIRFGYANIPVGTLVQRDWYVNGALFRTVQEAWSGYLGATGRVSNISLYDYINGLPAGNWRVVVSFPALPGVRDEVTFSIGSATTTTGVFSNVTFSTTPYGQSYSVLPAYLQQIFVRWNHTNAPAGGAVVARLFRNGGFVVEIQQQWLGSGNGSAWVYFYSFQPGFLPGNYAVEVSLRDVPGVIATGYFRIG